MPVSLGTRLVALESKQTTPPSAETWRLRSLLNPDPRLPEFVSAKLRETSVVVGVSPSARTNTSELLLVSPATRLFDAELNAIDLSSPEMTKKKSEFEPLPTPVLPSRLTETIDVVGVPTRVRRKTSPLVPLESLAAKFEEFDPNTAKEPSEAIPLTKTVPLATPLLVALMVTSWVAASARRRA